MSIGSILYSTKLCFLPLSRSSINSWMLGLSDQLGKLLTIDSLPIAPIIEKWKEEGIDTLACIRMCLINEEKMSLS